MFPCASSRILSESESKQVTGVPKSARHAETMVARYPDPYTAMYITNLSCAALLGVSGVEMGEGFSARALSHCGLRSYLYSSREVIRNVELGHVRKVVC